MSNDISMSDDVYMLEDNDSMDIIDSDSLHHSKQHDKYADIDNRINEEASSLPAKTGQDLTDFELGGLLHIIKRHSVGIVSVPVGIDTLLAHPDLKDALRAAWDAKSYTGILKLDYLTSGSVPQSTSQGSIEALSPEYYKQPLSEAWNVPFQGNYHRVLLNNINTMYDKKPYMNICAIVQSSGTGKSRIVDEQAKLVYTLPINIRNDESSVATYPPADRPLRKYLVENAPTTVDACKAYYVAFLRTLFLRACGELSKLNASNNGFAAEWYQEMADATKRNKFYLDVVEESCNNSLNPSSNARKELKELISKLRERRPSLSKKIKVVLYIDEAHELRDKVGIYTRFEILCSVISTLYTEPLFCLLLSTQSSIRFLAPPREVANSERAKKAALLPPITETPFDCSPHLAIKPGVLRMENLALIDYVAMWGRPLWWSMLQGEGSDVDAGRLLDLARLKLLRSHAIEARYVNTTRLGLIAVLDVLLGFDFEPDRARTNDVQADLVKSHMRITYSVPEHRLYIRSGYPSEPLLAEAAAQQLWSFQECEGTNSFDMMTKILNITDLVADSLIDLGHRGELVMRIFLMRARGCKLVTFIKELFGSMRAQMIFRAIPDNIIDGTTFAEAFKDSMVRFTHFVRAGSEYAFSSAVAYAAFARGVAIIGHPTQKYVDFAIPILLNKHDTLQEPAMSTLLIQVKRHLRASGPTTYTFSQRSINVFPKNGNAESLGRPYILFVAELGMQPEEGHVGDIETPCVHILEQSVGPEDTHPQYGFVGYGGSIYKHVSEDACTKLLGRNFIEEHCRGDDISRSLVMRLKPIWEQGEDTFHWVELPPE